MDIKDKVRLQNLVRIYARTGRWEDARKTADLLRRGSREPKTVEGDPTVW